MFERGIEFGRQMAVGGGRGAKDFISVGKQSFWRGGEIIGNNFATFAWVHLAVFAAVVVALIVVVAVCANKRKKAALLEPLKQKFVNGDIDESTYLSKKATLLGK